MSINNNQWQIFTMNPDAIGQVNVVNTPSERSNEISFQPTEAPAYPTRQTSGAAVP
jgi:hypothetical protein